MQSGRRLRSYPPPQRRFRRQPGVGRM